MTFDEVLMWGVKAAPNAKLEYYQGGMLNHFQRRHNWPDAVWGVRYLFNTGDVDLVQKRLGEGSYKYIAVKRSTPAKSSKKWEIPERFLVRVR